MFGTRDSLIAAVKLTDLPGISIDTHCSAVTYIHLLFNQHEVIFANGAPCESLHTGAEAMKSIPSRPSRIICPISGTDDRSKPTPPGRAVSP